MLNWPQTPGGKSQLTAKMAYSFFKEKKSSDHRWFNHEMRQYKLCLDLRPNKK